MIEVTKDQFYKIIGPLDVCISTVGDFPYTSEWRIRHTGILKGKNVESYPEVGRYPTISRYYVSEDLIKTIKEGTEL